MQKISYVIHYCDFHKVTGETNIYYIEIKIENRNLEIKKKTKKTKIANNGPQILYIEQQQ